MGWWNSQSFQGHCHWTPQDGLIAPHMNTPAAWANMLKYVGLWPMAIKLNPLWKTEVSKSAWIKFCINWNYWTWKEICTRITILYPMCIQCRWDKVLSLFKSIDQWMFNYDAYPIDSLYDKHEFFDLNLQNDCYQYKPRKYVGCFYDYNWYNGIIVESSNENQDCSIKCIKRNDLNLHWISDSLWVAAG